MRRSAVRRAWAIALCISFGIHGVLAASLAILPAPEARRAVETRIDVQIAPEGVTELVRERSEPAALATDDATAVGTNDEAVEASGPALTDEAAPPPAEMAALMLPQAGTQEVAREGGQAEPAAAAAEAQPLDTVAPDEVAAVPREPASTLAGQGDAGAELSASVDAAALAALAMPPASAVAGAAQTPSTARQPERSGAVAREVEREPGMPAAPSPAPAAAISDVAPAEASQAAPPAPQIAASAAGQSAALDAPAGTVAAASDAGSVAVASVAPRDEIVPQAVAPSEPLPAAISGGAPVAVVAATPQAMSSVPVPAAAAIVLGASEGAAVAGVAGNAVAAGSAPPAAALAPNLLVLDAEAVSPAADTRTPADAAGVTLAPSAAPGIAPVAALPAPGAALANSAGGGGAIMPAQTGPQATVSSAASAAVVAGRGGIAMGDGVGSPGAAGSLPPAVAVAPVEPGAEVAAPAPVGDEAPQHQDVAVLLPARPALPEAPADVIDLRERLIEHLSSYDGGDCFLAVPAGGAATLAVSGFGIAPGQLSQLAEELSQAAGAAVDAQAHAVTSDQCGALSFARALSPRSVPQIGITPQAQAISSGAVLSGSIEKPARRFLHLLLVDDTGTVQRFRNLVERGDGTVGFSAPMTLIDGPVTTPQLLVAVATDDPLETLFANEGLHADRYFSALADEVERTGGEIEFGLTHFFVR